jgi:hypothetical protein
MTPYIIPPLRLFSCFWESGVLRIFLVFVDPPLFRLTKFGCGLMLHATLMLQPAFLLRNCLPLHLHYQAFTLTTPVTQQMQGRR